MENGSVRLVSTELKARGEPRDGVDLLESRYDPCLDDVKVPSPEDAVSASEFPLILFSNAPKPGMVPGVGEGEGRGKLAGRTVIPKL